MSERTTPHSLEAERAVLGALLVNNELYYDVCEQIDGSHFFRQAHRTLFEAMRGLADKRQPIDPITIRASLTPGALEDVGGPAYIVGLTDGVARSTNVEYYARLVKEQAIRRKLQAAADQAIREASDTEIEAAAALERAEQAIYAIAEREQRGDLRSAQSVLTETVPILERLQESGRPITGVAMGFYDLDEKTRGLQPGNLVLLAARPAMGKTAIALNIAHYVAVSTDATVAVFSLEMSRTELMIRLLTAAGRVDAHRIMSGRWLSPDYERVSTAMAEIGAAPIWIDDTSHQTVTSIRGKARRLKAKRGLGLVIVDYLQLLSSERKYDNRVVEVGAMSRALKQLAKELDAPVLCLSQLNRAPEARKGGRPQLADLRESGSLEQDADLVLLLYREEEYEPKPDNAGIAELIIAKHRNGPIGTVRLRWSKEQTRFDNLSQAGHA